MLPVIPEMEAKSRVYLDHNATTRPSSEVTQAVIEGLQSFGNPSSIHWASREPKAILRDARLSLSKYLDCHPLEIIFNSGGTESNNTVINSFLYQNKNEFITTEVEHPSVLKSFQWLESRGAKVHYVPVSRSGQLNMQFFTEKLSQNTGLVSVMLANNETGTLFPIKEITKLAHAHGAKVHSDCVQGLGKTPLSLRELNLDYASFSAHKFYALKGVGFLFVKKGSSYQNLIRGGAQERSRRGGTENTIGITSLMAQSKKLSLIGYYAEKMRLLRDEFEKQIFQQLDGVKITAAESERLPNTSSLVISGVDGETLLMSLDLNGFAVSTGAACSSGNPEPSPVLLAMGLSREEAQSSLRVSLGWETTPEEIQSFIKTLVTVVQRLRGLNQKTEKTSLEIEL